MAGRGGVSLGGRRPRRGATGTQTEKQKQQYPYLVRQSYRTPTPSLTVTILFEKEGALRAVHDAEGASLLISHQPLPCHAPHTLSPLGPRPTSSICIVAACPKQQTITLPRLNKLRNRRHAASALTSGCHLRSPSIFSSTYYPPYLLSSDHLTAYNSDLEAHDTASAASQHSPGRRATVERHSRFSQVSSFDNVVSWGEPRLSGSLGASAVQDLC